MLNFGRRAHAAASSAVHGFRNESRVLGFARTLIVVAQLSIILITPYSALFVPVGNQEALASCSGTGPGVLSVYCFAPPGLATAGMAIGLLIVGSGFRPRWSTWLHLYCSLSFGTAVDLPDGGDHVAIVITFWMAVASINDRRTWHWQPPTGQGRNSVFAGVAWAGYWAVRLQIAYIYLNSGIAKLAVESWQEGSATYYVTRMEFFGASGPVGDVARFATSIPFVALATTWGTIAIELCIAIFILSSPFCRRIAFWLAACLHIFIIITLGLFSFGLIMIGSVLVATATAFECAHKFPLRSTSTEDNFVGEPARLTTEGVAI